MNIEHLAVQLRALANSSVVPFFPSVKELCRRTGQSRHVVRRALALVRAEGAIDFSRGSRIRIVRGPSAPGSALSQGIAGAGQDRRLSFTDKMRQSLLSGSWHSGDILPKIAVLAELEGVSNKTVGIALRNLEREGLVYRHGRCCIVGRRPLARNRFVRGKTNASMVVIMPSEDTWHELFCSPSTNEFVVTFFREAQVANVSLVPFIAARSAGQSISPSIAAGKFSKLLLSLGSSYKGAIMLGSLGDYVVGTTYSLLDLARVTAALKRPTVWFDHFRVIPLWGQPPDSPYAEVLMQLKERPIHAYPDDAGAARCAVDTLCELGHRTAAFPPGPLNHFIWVRFRYKKAVEAATKRGLTITDPTLGMAFTTEDLAVLVRDAATTPETSTSWRTPTKLTPDRAAKAEMVLLDNMLEPIVKERSASVIIAYNDFIARKFMVWLDTKGIRAPEDLSVLSFDASVDEAFPYAISSVDFGMRGLAYETFHLIMQDLPRFFRSPRNREMPSRCSLNHAGTLGRAKG